ncbi:MAG: YfiT family bacillithiol transferase [Gemmatimonadaceae bacterium]
MSTTSPAEPDLRYPIGKLDRKTVLTPAERAAAIDTLAAAPNQLRAAVAGLSDARLDTPYRPGGWTVRQLVHHVADSHMNAYMRFRLAFTEENPTIKPYEESKWAELVDARTMPPDVSLSILDAIHARLVTLLRATPDEAFQRQLSHPQNGPMTVDGLLAMYSWHCKHHLAHVTRLKEREQWT